MSSALATVAPNGVQTITDTRKRDELLRHLILPKASPEQLELVLAICARYNFDPLLRHILIINSNIYVTRDGLRHMAWQSGEFDGYDPFEERKGDDGKWVVTVKVWRKGIDRPFVATAYQSEAENTQSPVWRSHPRLMTGKVAEVIALRMAFGVSLGGAEEVGFEDATPRTNIGEARFVEVAPAALPAPVEATPAAPAIDFAAWSASLDQQAADGLALRAIAEEAGRVWDRLTDDQAQAVTVRLEQIKAARKAGRAAPVAGPAAKPTRRPLSARSDEGLLALVIDAGLSNDQRADAARAFLNRAADAEGLFARVAQLTVLDFPRAILDVLVAEQRERLGLPDDEDAGEVIAAVADDTDVAAPPTGPTWVGDDDVPFD